mgnify:CR=1 FL=1
MGTDERHTESSYNPAMGFASECPYCSNPAHLKVIMPDGTEAVDVTDQYTFRPPDLSCSACGVTLTPIEIALDLGDGPEHGPELLCDHCLVVSN